MFVNVRVKKVVPVLGGKLLGGVLFFLGVSAWAEGSPKIWETHLKKGYGIS
jgi:hypothetical protein